MKPEKSIISGLTRLGKNDLDKAVDCLTDAFSEDPSMKYLLRSDKYDPEKARFIHEYTLKYALQYEHVFVTSNSIEGVGVWLPPKVNNHSAFMHVWNFIISGGLRMDKHINPGTIDIMKKYGTYSSKMHHKYAKGPHWYLMSIAVSQEFQGKGYSKKLVLPMLEFFDKNAQSCYLETHLPGNVAFYERYGFKTMGTGKLPGSDYTHWAMFREAQI